MPETITVSYGQPAPNKMFAPELTALLRFVTYSEKVECAYCKKRTKKQWTLLCPFKVADMGMSRFAIIPSARVFGAGDAVCSKHFLIPALPKEMIAGYGDAIPFEKPSEE